MADIGIQQRVHTPKLRVGMKYVDLETTLANTTKYLVNPDGTLTERGTALGISTDTAARLLAMNTDYSLKMSAYRDIDRPHSAVKDIQEAYKEYDREIRALQQSLKKNINITLTPEDYDMLEIHRDSGTTTPVQPEDAPPVITIYKSILGGVMEMKFTRSGSAANVDRRAMPYRQAILAETWHTMSEETPTTEPEQHYFKTVIHKFPSPPGSGRGTILHIRACYVTETGKKSPLSIVHKCSVSF